MRKIESIIGNPDRLISHIKQTLDNLESTKNQIFNQLKPLDLEAASIREDMAIVNARLENAKSTSLITIVALINWKRDYLISTAGNRKQTR